MREPREYGGYANEKNQRKKSSGNLISEMRFPSHNKGNQSFYTINL